MARLFLGQRVRVNPGADCDTLPDAVRGAEGFVNEFNCENEDGQSGHVGVTIMGDPNWAFLPHELEPILPEGAQPSEFSFTQLMDNLGVVVA